MALEDINFQEGEKQLFILEIIDGNQIYRPSDILIETKSNSFPCLEIIGATGNGNIFIISD